MIFALAVLEVVAINYVYGMIIFFYLIFYLFILFYLGTYFLFISILFLGMRRVLEDIKFMLDIDLGIYWKFCWGYLIPISLTFFFVYFIIIMEPLTYGGLPFPDMAISKLNKKCIQFINRSTK